MAHPSVCTDWPEPLDELVVVFGPVALRNRRPDRHRLLQSDARQRNRCAMGCEPKNAENTEYKREKKNLFTYCTPAHARACFTPVCVRTRDRWVKRSMG